MPYDHTFVGTPMDCNFVCSRYDRCQTYLFDAATKRCQLFDGPGGETVSTPAAAATPPSTGSAPGRVPGGGATYDYTFVGSQNDCDFVCSQDSRCRSTIYDAASKKCQLIGTGRTATVPPGATPTSSSKSTPAATGPLRRTTTFVSSKADCDFVCQQNNGCRSSSYDAATKKCTYEARR
jgi:hypothetical protein